MSWVQLLILSKKNAGDPEVPLFVTSILETSSCEKSNISIFGRLKVGCAFPEARDTVRVVAPCVIFNPELDPISLKFVLTPFGYVPEVPI